LGKGIAFPRLRIETSTPRTRTCPRGPGHGAPAVLRIDAGGKQILHSLTPSGQSPPAGDPDAAERSFVQDDKQEDLCALFDGDPVGGVDGADVFGAGTDEAVVVELLDDVGGPACDAADGEDGRVEIDVDAEGGVG
jgi:hypothetical protein